MKLKTKFSIWGIGSSIFIMTISGIAWFSANKLLYSSERVTHTYDVMAQTESIYKNIELLEYQEELYLIFHEQKLLDIYKEVAKDVDKEISRLSEVLWSSSQKDKLLKFRAILSEWESKSEKEIFGTTLTDSLKLTKAQMDRLVSEDPILAKAKNELRDFQKIEDTLMIDRKNVQANTISNILMIIFLSSLLLLVMNVIISFMFSMRIRNSLDSTNAKMKDIVEGKADLTKKMEPYTNDEISEFTNMFNTFTDKLRVMIKELQGEAIILSTSSRDLSRTSSTLSNQAVATSSATGHMFSAMEDLKQVTETNYGATSKHLKKNEENITDFIKNVSIDVNAQKADDLASELKLISGSIIEINGKVQKIEGIIRSIGEISRQSNILSVNASIQANKAGEYGQPFAVIASEIRALSVNSGNVIKNIVSEIRETMSLSNKITLNIEKVDKSMKEYAKNTSIYNFTVLEKSQVLKDNNVAIQKLEESRKSQIDGLKLLTNAMENIKDSSDFNASGARDLQNASATLEKLSKSLLAQAANFKT